MSLSKVAAWTFVGLFILQLAPAIPAQTTGNGGDDLKIVDILADNPVRGVATTITVRVQNIGDETFSPTFGSWQVFVGWNGLDDQDCITGRPTVPGTGACYIQTDMTIAPGVTEELTLQWTPTDTQVPSRDPAVALPKIWADIGNPGSQSQTLGEPDGDFPCTTSSPGTNCLGVPVFVADPRVTAYPLRVAPPEPEEATPNTPWPSNLVTLNCVPANTQHTAINDRACKSLPGELVEFEFNVTNGGNRADTIRASLVDTTTPASQNLSSRGYQVFFTPATLPLDAGQTGIVRVQILVPENAPLGSGVNINSRDVYARFASSLNPAITTQRNCPETGDSEGRCPTLPTLVARAKAGMYVEANQTWATLDANRAYQFNVTVNNTGNALKNYRLYWERDGSTINDSWQPGLLPISNVSTDTDGKRFTSVNIRPGSRENLSISVIPPANATRDFYNIRARIQDGAGELPAQFKDFTAELRPRYALSAASLTSLARIVPDEEATYSLFVRNDGNAPHNVTIRFESSPSANGWEKRISDTEATIPAFGTLPLTVTARPPPNTKNDTEATFFVNVTSRDEPQKAEKDRANATVNFQAFVLRGPNLRVSTPVSSAFIDPGQTQAFTLDVQNTGNVADTYRITRLPGDPLWVVNVQPAELNLTPLQSGSVTVTMRAPGDGDIGESTKAFIKVASTVDTARDKTVNITGTISGPDMFVESVNLGQAEVYSGDAVELSVLIGNRGNKGLDRNTTLRLEYLRDGVPVLIGEEIPLLPGDLPGGIRVTKRVTWNTTGIEGSVTLRATIDPQNRVVELDDTVTSNVATRPVTLRVFDIRVTQAEGLSARPGERVTYGEEPNVFVVEYRGNQDNEPVDVVIESENGWVRREFSLGLKPFSPVALPVDFVVPQNPGVAADTLRLTLTPTLRPDSPIVSQATTTVIDDRAPILLDVGASPQTLGVGGDVRIFASVADETGIREVRAYIVSPGGANDTTSLLLGDEGGGRYAASYTPDRAGTFRYYVVAIDGSTAGNSNTSADVVRTFQVTPGSLPQIALAANQSATIRTGSIVRLAITDPLGIAQANYTIRGITYEMERPFDEIDTSSFAAGTVDLLVTAENLYGGVTSERITLTVDNTPPTIRSVTVTPETPKVNEETRVRIETDSDASVVEVAIKRDGQLVATHTANRTAGGWEVVFNPGEGENVIDVTAKDVAGNPRLMQAAATFTAKPAGFLGIPGFELVAALGAVAVALLLRRKRD